MELDDENKKQKEEEKQVLSIDPITGEEIPPVNRIEILYNSGSLRHSFHTNTLMKCIENDPQLRDPITRIQYSKECLRQIFNAMDTNKLPRYSWLELRCVQEIRALFRSLVPDMNNLSTLSSGKEIQENIESSESIAIEILKVNKPSLQRKREAILYAMNAVDRLRTKIEEIRLQEEIKALQQEQDAVGDYSHLPVDTLIEMGLFNGEAQPVARRTGHGEYVIRRRRTTRRAVGRPRVTRRVNLPSASPVSVVSVPTVS